MTMTTTMTMTILMTMTTTMLLMVKMMTNYDQQQLSYRRFINNPLTPYHRTINVNPVPLSPFNVA